MTPVQRFVLVEGAKHLKGVTAVGDIRLESLEHRADEDSTPEP